MSPQLAQYLPVLLLAGVAVAFAVGMLVFSVLLGVKARRNPVKDSPYECGMAPQGEGSTRFSVKFYLVAMLFVIFDLEAVFIFAWAISFREVGWAGYIEVLIFIGILLAALAYLWRVGALDWSPPRRHRRLSARTS